MKIDALNGRDKNATFRHDILFDTDDNPTHWFELVGSNSEQYQKAEREWNVKAYRKLGRRGGRGYDASKEEDAKVLTDEQKRYDLHMVKACIVSIHGFTSEGQPMDRTDENLDALFEERPTWIVRLLRDIRVDRDFT